MFDAPIPGESLTQPKGSNPFEQTPKFADPKDALEFMWDKLTKPRNQAKLVAYFKSNPNANAEALARTSLFTSFQKGYYTPDVALSIGNTVHQMIVAIGQRAVDNGLMAQEDLVIHNPDKDMDEFMLGLDVVKDKPVVVTNQPEDIVEPAPSVDLEEQSEEDLLGGL